MKLNELIEKLQEIAKYIPDDVDICDVRGGSSFNGTTSIEFTLGKKENEVKVSYEFSIKETE